jgi:hypothetical protein
MAKMKLQTGVALAEIVSALAVVLSLLYVANEFKRSRTLTSTDVQTILYDRVLEMNRLMIESDGLAELLILARERPGSLAPGDSMRFVAFEHVFYDSWELAWTAHSDGVMEEVAWESWDSWFGAEAQRKPVLGWAGNQRHYPPDFVEYVNGRVRPK